MTMHMTKTWIENGKLITEVFKSEDVYTRTWVGLSREDCYQVRERESDAFMFGVAWAEAKLKEKNNGTW